MSKTHVSPGSMAFPHGVPHGPVATVHVPRPRVGHAAIRVLDSLEWGLLSMAIYACPTIVASRGHVSTPDILAMSGLGLATAAVANAVARRRGGVLRDVPNKP